jgi:dihydroorotase
VAALDKLEGFASFYGADFYGLPRNEARITLARESSQIPASLPYLPGDDLIPFMAGESLAWRLQSDA